MYSTYYIVYIMQRTWCASAQYTMCTVQLYNVTFYNVKYIIYVNNVLAYKNEMYDVYCTMYNIHVPCMYNVYTVFTSCIQSQFLCISNPLLSLFFVLLSQFLSRFVCTCLVNLDILRWHIYNI